MFLQQGGKYKRPTIRINGKQMLVSRVVMENKLGRRLLSNELVHHKDENSFNNKIGNLLLTNRSEHKKIHSNIGFDTRLKKIYKFDSKKLKILYFRYKSAKPISKKMKCHVITIERELRKILKVNSLKQYKRSVLCK